MIEILAPAGNFDSLRAGVLAGANAVYFGASSFNARRNADNFSAENLRDAVSLCHVRGVQAYMTLNTLISDAELPSAMELVNHACDIGVDAIIIQDLGLAASIRRTAPDMPLHASTQMTVHTRQGMELLADFGFKRVVLARETPKEQIKYITKTAAQRGVTTEVFVHGALCMSVSGQCLFSAMLGGRSGNRGLCAGTCRLPFSVQGGNGYDLSLKDLCLLDKAKELEAMGVASLKIEGRMKRPEYVAMATHAARSALSKEGLSNDEKQRLQTIFSRNGFTDGYYTGRRGADMFGARSEEQIKQSKQQEAAIHEIYRNEYPHVGVNMNTIIKSGQPTTLTVSDGENTVTVQGAAPEIAQNSAITKETVIEKLSKCGGTPYFIADCSVDLDNGLQLRISHINEMRREALDKLTELRAKTRSISYDEYKPNKLSPHAPAKPYRVLSVHCENQIPDSLRKDDIILLPLFTDEKVISVLIKKGCSLAVKTPTVLFSREEKIKEQLCKVKSLGINLAFAENLGSINLIKSAGLEFFGGIGLNCYNSDSLKVITEFGAKSITLSAELSDSQIRELGGDTPRGILAYGRLPLMVLENCPRKAYNGCKDCDGVITDRKSEKFYLMCEDGVCKLYNNRPLYLADRPRILQSVDFHVYLFTDETKQQVKSVLSGYENGAEAQGNYTRGMYQKGVL